MVTQRQELDSLKHYANSKITKVFDALEIVYEEKYTHIVAPCPIHDGERGDAWSWHIDYGVFQCFSRGCHKEWGKDVFGLVRGVKECSFPAAVNFLKRLFDGEEGYNAKEIAHLKESKKFVAQVKRTEQKIYEESAVNRLKYHNYLESRNYPKELVMEYQAGVPSSKYKRMSNRIIFPIRNIDGHIVGFTGRTLYEDWKLRKIGKWEHSAGFDKKSNLFNIDRAAKPIEETGIAIIVEGPLDVLRLEQAGIKNAVAIFGRTIENGQISLLFRCGANELIVALDADTAGRSGAESTAQVAKSFFKITNVDLGDGDVGDLTPKRALETFIPLLCK